MASVIQRPGLFFTLAVCAFPLLVAPAFAAGTTPQLRGTDGLLHDPLATNGAKATVIIFIADDCPISNGYAPEINRLCAAYSPQGVRFTLVSTDTNAPAASIKQHAQQYGYRCPDLLDPGHVLVKQVGATVTPEAAVFSPTGRLLYKGRIDDKYADFGKVRFAATTHDLQTALDAVVAGKPVRHAATKAVGCPL